MAWLYKITFSETASKRVSHITNSIENTAPFPYVECHMSPERTMTVMRDVGRHVSVSHECIYDHRQLTKHPVLHILDTW